MSVKALSSTYSSSHLSKVHLKSTLTSDRILNLYLMSLRTAIFFLYTIGAKSLLMEFQSISDQFNAQFSLVVANTPKLLEEVFKIRYQVYCQELHYEPIENFPDGMEKDIYDCRSLHCLLKHLKSGMYAGCIRLVLADPQDPEEAFPFEKVCRDALWRGQNGQADKVSLLSAMPLRSSCGEVSRLAVRGEFRKRKGEFQTPTGVSWHQSLNDENERRGFPLIALSLCLAATSIALKSGTDPVYTLMEAKLERHLRRYGIPFQQVGDFVDHHGQRGTFMITREMVCNSLSSHLRDLLQTISSQIKMSDVHLSSVDMPSPTSAGKLRL